MNMNFQSIVYWFVLLKVEGCKDVLDSFNGAVGWIRNSKIISPDIFFGVWIANGILSGLNKSYCPNWIDLSMFHSPKGRNVYEGIALEAIANGNLKLDRDLLVWPLREKSSMECVSLADYLLLIDEGVPTRELSDICIAQTLSSESCVVSSECMNLILFENESSGYHKTHKVMLALLIQSQSCQQHVPFGTSISLILEKLCRSVLKEMDIIIELDFPSNLRDLFLEQSLLCGLAGFQEYFDKKMVRKILSWQTDSGCFAPVDTNNDSDCSEHMSSLGLVYASLLSRHCNSDGFSNLLI